MKVIFNQNDQFLQSYSIKINNNSIPVTKRNIYKVSYITQRYTGNSVNVRLHLYQFLVLSATQS